MNIIEQFNFLMEQFLSKKQPDQLCTCPKCNGQPPYFKFHSIRKRVFLLIIDSFVNKIHSHLNRWKCPFCDKTFTHYPDFLIPYKQYTTNDIVRLSQRYIQNDNTTYRKIVTNDGAPIGYYGSECQFEASTVWRWISFIGSLVQPLTNALNLIKQKSPSSNIFRQITPIKPIKYRSEDRKTILSNSMRFFIAQKELKNFFGISIFSPTLQQRL